MILGTWNLEVYASPRSRRGSQQIEALLHHDADVWFLTELHADHTLPGHTLAYAPPRQEAPLVRRKAAIASRWPMESIRGEDDPVEGRLCMARLHSPETGESLLAVCSVLPWRGATPHWRELLGQNLA